jgi:hypothetical protein
VGHGGVGHGGISGVSLNRQGRQERQEEDREERGKWNPQRRVTSKIRGAMASLPFQNGGSVTLVISRSSRLGALGVLGGSKFPPPTPAASPDFFL